MLKALFNDKITAVVRPAKGADYQLNVVVAVRGACTRAGVERVKMKSNSNGTSMMIPSSGERCIMSISFLQTHAIRTGVQRCQKSSHTRGVVAPVHADAALDVVCDEAKDR